jgi:hypothetical protein
MAIARSDMMVRIVCKSGREFEEIQLRLESVLKLTIPNVSNKAGEGMHSQIHMKCRYNSSMYRYGVL